ncbi:MAG TPA: hypothetical protein VK524_23485 [Polyangiaceae bacterium]|nr:hypothetical protein [Polyangiaceae bacterium]
MKRALVTVMAVATVGLLSGCGAESGQEAVDATEQGVLFGSEFAVSPTVISSPTLSSTFVAKPPRGELIGRDDPKGRGQFNSFDAHLSALGLATLKCKGFVDPDDYDGSNGVLKQRFEKCTKDEKQLEHIRNLLGIQNVSDLAARHMAGTWEQARKQFPRDQIKVCPAWDHSEVINPPTFETVKNLPSGGIGEEFNAFYVKSEICQGPRCAVAHAKMCSAGFGSRFFVDGNIETGKVIVDPVWWLDDSDFPPDANPFLSPGYYHAMSFYGAVPGSVYGAVHRAGEYCSKYYAGYHYKLRLKPLYCAPDWICMTECK